LNSSKPNKHIPKHDSQISCTSFGQNFTSKINPSLQPKTNVKLTFNAEAVTEGD